MKKKANHTHKPILKSMRYVGDRYGYYTCEVIKDENAIFSKYINDINKPKGVLLCCIRHDNPRKLERFLGLDSKQEELTYLSFEGTDISHGDYKVSSEIEKIDYNRINKQFIVRFYHLITFSDGLTAPLPKRSVQISIPKTLSMRLTDYLKKIFTPKSPAQQQPYF